MRDYPTVQVASRNELPAWFRRHHASHGPIWLISFKKASGERYLPYAAIVEEALCFGWIDSLPRKLDAERSMLLLTPRKPGSGWSKPNRERVARLTAAGLMAPSGLAVVAQAKADGSWDRLKAAERGVVPDDLAAALDAAGASAQWKAFSTAVRRNSLAFLQDAKAPSTRARRIARIVGGAAAGTDPLRWRPKP